MRISDWSSDVCSSDLALAAGNAMILKPSEEAPGSAAIFAEVMEKAGVPAGVFNLIQGDGPGVGTALAQHPGIDMVSFTGSTRVGIQVAKNAADTVKRVHQEMGRSEEQTSELQSLMRHSYGGFCWKKTK